MRRLASIRYRIGLFVIELPTETGIQLCGVRLGAPSSQSSCFDQMNGEASRPVFQVIQSRGAVGTVRRAAPYKSETCVQARLMQLVG
jgi:hypothetical protein